jgi:hypothetical protein
VVSLPRANIIFPASIRARTAGPVALEGVPDSGPISPGSVTVTLSGRASSPGEAGTTPGSGVTEPAFAVDGSTAGFGETAAVVTRVGRSIFAGSSAR